MGTIKIDNQNISVEIENGFCNAYAVAECADNEIEKYTVFATETEMDAYIDWAGLEVCNVESEECQSYCTETDEDVSCFVKCCYCEPVE